MSLGPQHRARGAGIWLSPVQWPGPLGWLLQWDSTLSWHPRPPWGGHSQRRSRRPEEEGLREHWGSPGCWRRLWAWDARAGGGGQVRFPTASPLRLRGVPGCSHSKAGASGCSLAPRPSVPRGASRRPGPAGPWANRHLPADASSDLPFPIPGCSFLLSPG